MPIENTLAGSVHENYDHLLNNDLPIVAETSVRIVHNLIAPPGVPFRKIRRVYSHPVALNQCLKFFADNPGIERVSFYDTAGSVKMIMEEGLEDAAGIASALAASNYGGKILKRSIEDDRRNFTRFFLLRRPEFARKFPVKTNSRTRWKTSLVFTTRNTPGALFRSLSAFALRDLSLTKIESRPCAANRGSISSTSISWAMWTTPCPATRSATCRRSPISIACWAAIRAATRAAGPRNASRAPIPRARCGDGYSAADSARPLRPACAFHPCAARGRAGPGRPR